MWHYRIFNLYGKVLEDSINTPAPFKGYRTEGEADLFGNLAFVYGNYSEDEYNLEIYKITEIN